MEGSMEFERARLDREGAVAILSMNHPEVLNAVSPEMLKGLTDALDALANSSERTRCLVITGVGRAFSAGANLQGRGNGPLPRGAGQALETLYHPFPAAAARPALSDHHCHQRPRRRRRHEHRADGRSHRLRALRIFPPGFRRIGLVPDCGSTWLLPRLIGRVRATELSLLGERLPAETALAWGLVTRVFDDAMLMPEARRLAHELAAGPTVALGLIRRLYWESPENAYRAAARSRMPHAAHRRRFGGLCRGRHGVFGEAAGPIRREMIVARIACHTGAWANRETRLGGVQSCYQE